MKKLLLTSFAALMFTASADAGFYVAGYLRGNDSVAQDNMDVFNNIAVDATVGYSFKNGLRLEADFFSMQLDGRFGDMNLGLGMARALYDIRINDKFVPYFGIGIGQSAGFPIQTGWQGQVDSFTFGGSLVAGVAFYLDRNLALDLQYSRFMGFTIGDNNDINMAGNEVRLGMRYHF